MVRSGPWRERAAAGLVSHPWKVVHESGTPALTDKGTVRRFRRRAHAYAYAEKLNREDAARQREALEELGL